MVLLIIKCVVLSHKFSILHKIVEKKTICTMHRLHFKITLKIKEFIFSLAFYSNHSSITPVHVEDGDA